MSDDCPDVIITSKNEDLVIETTNEDVIVVSSDTTDIIEVTESEVVVVTENVDTIIETSQQGPPGRDGQEIALHKELSFDFSQINGSLVIGGVVPNQKITKTILEITEAFDGIDFGVTVGTNVSTAILMTIAENSPDVEGSYSKINNLDPAETDVYSIFFTYSDLPTQGQAVITIFFG